MDAALEGLKPKVTEKKNDRLAKPFTAKDISEALAQTCPTKTPGPDGLPTVFFQKHWQSIKEGVLSTCLHILNDQSTIAPLNHTYIALIPKIAKSRKVTNYRPISLCNVIYRIVIKAIANKLKSILAQIIALTQSAFIPNRLIMDNIIIRYECLHKIRLSKGKKNGKVALKLDISKVYDRIEWGFLKVTMKRLRFTDKWIELTLNCITTASFSVLINGTAKGLIQPQSGLRKGCPLSSYLLILCVEAFFNLLLQEKKES